MKYMYDKLQMKYQAVLYNLTSFYHELISFKKIMLIYEMLSSLSSKDVK